MVVLTAGLPALHARQLDTRFVFHHGVPCTHVPADDLSCRSGEAVSTHALRVGGFRRNTLSVSAPAESRIVRIELAVGREQPGVICRTWAVLPDARTAVACEPDATARSGRARFEAVGKTVTEATAPILPVAIRSHMISAVFVNLEPYAQSAELRVYSVAASGQARPRP